MHGSTSGEIGLLQGGGGYFEDGAAGERLTIRRPPRNVIAEGGIPENIIKNFEKDLIIYGF